MEFGLKKKNIIFDLDAVSWLLLIFFIEFFFVFAPMTANYNLMSAISIILLVTLMINFKIKINRFIIILIITFIYYIVRATMNSKTIDAFFLLIFLLCIVFSSKKITKKKIDYIYNILIIMGIFFSIGVILQYFFIDKFMTLYYPFFKPNFQVSIRRQVIINKMFTGWTSQTFATSINIILAILACFYKNQTKKSKKITGLIILFVISLLLVGKRGPTLFLLLSIFVTQTFLQKDVIQFFKKFSKYIFISILIIIGIYIYANYFVANSRNTIVRILEGIINSDSDISNGRFILWELAISLFKGKPILGIGWGNYSSYALSVLGNEIQAHNVYLQLLAEVGIVGLVLFIILLFNSLRSTRKKINQYTDNSDATNILKFSYNITIYFILYCLTGNNLYDFNVLFLLVLAWIISNANYEFREK